MLKKAMIGLGVVLGLAVIGVAGGAFAAHTVAQSKLGQTFESHTYTLQVPMPLTEAEIEALRAERLAALEAAGEATANEDGTPVDVLADVDLDALARERAIERGKHLLASRYGCVECHGADFSGGTMIDDPAIGLLMGPNLTMGEGSVTRDYTPADWERKIRHGVNPAGRGGPMPSEDFILMSDQELADIITTIRAAPPVDNEVPPVRLGPVGTLLMAAGKLPLAAEHHAGGTEHAALPPPTEPSVAFGKHLANVCIGCHRENFEGGRHPAGPPDWLPAANLTAGEGGVRDHYDLDSFKKVMRTGVRPDGTSVGMPMTLMVPYNAKMTDVELEALWIFLQTLPPVPSGK